jgi:hypothetical protein
MLGEAELRAGSVSVWCARDNVDDAADRRVAVEDGAGSAEDLDALDRGDGNAHPLRERRARGVDGNSIDQEEDVLVLVAAEESASAGDGKSTAAVEGREAKSRDEAKRIGERARLGAIEIGAGDDANRRGGRTQVEWDAVRDDDRRVELMRRSRGVGLRRRANGASDEDWERECARRSDRHG